MKKKKKQLFLELAEKYRDMDTVPPCSHFSECGGCMFQDIPYEKQLLLKREYLNTLMDGLCSIESVIPAEPYRYRNRMDFVTAFGKAGLRKRGSYRHVVDIHSCEIMQQRSNEIFTSLRPSVLQVDDYDYLAHRGYLRYVVIRQGRFTGQCMVNLVTAARENQLGDLPEKISEQADSVSILLNEGKADISFGEILENVKTGFIEEALGDLRFRIRPNSFFQSNSEIALAMYRRIRNNVKGDVLDLYSGVGSITLFVSSHAETVTGVEIHPEGVQMALTNREINNITNANFVCGDTGDFLKENQKKFHTLVLDPPRAGIHPKTIKHIATMNPDTIIYMSCNPASFRRDVEMLESFSLEEFEAFDMFPQTPHIETLALLRRK